MRKFVLLVAMAASVAVGCGSSSSSETTTVDTVAQERTREEARKEREAEQRRAEEQVQYDDCRKLVGRMLTKAEELDSRLSIGLTYEKYGTAVADVRVVYDRVDFDELAANPKCLTEVGLSVERALNQYARAAGIWSECFESWDCDMDTIDAKLQEKWSSAGRSLEKARDNLDAMEPEQE